MLQELAITPATIVIIAAIAIMAFFAVRRMLRKGLCDCGEKCDHCSKCANPGGCKDGKAAKCPAATRITKSMEAALK